MLSGGDKKKLEDKKMKLIRRFDGCNMRQVHLITRKFGNFVERDLIVQYDDSIVRLGITS